MTAEPEPVRARSAGARALGILGGLLAFGAAEVAVALLGGRAATGILIALMIAQAAFFALFSMHLRDETRGLRRMAALPMIIAAVYALVLVAESAWRHKP
jgi:heme/copper-type cytochrome/quinol oxidase subunit 4